MERRARDRRTRSAGGPGSPDNPRRRSGILRENRSRQVEWEGFLIPQHRDEADIRAAKPDLAPRFSTGWASELAHPFAGGLLRTPPPIPSKRQFLPVLLRTTECLSNRMATSRNCARVAGWSRARMGRGQTAMRSPPSATSARTRCANSAHHTNLYGIRLDRCVMDVHYPRHRMAVGTSNQQDSVLSNRIAARSVETYVNLSLACTAWQWLDDRFPCILHCADNCLRGAMSAS